ncbi:auxin transport protein BIG-like [Dorcoceras hygrometricum]|uniref:Auxin transport protein BIG-like n=1 Tax=Dorcoceras hygrometricum TaxID=472368 RepID=A0A2Z6ZUF5_9LAMI|nr:auxin transport protein BIG-like [Dorcoceras hygrometricum]
MRYGSYPLASTESWYAQNQQQQGIATTDLSSRDKCVYATDTMFNIESYTIHKAYTAASIITNAQSKAVKQSHIRTSSLLCNNYYKQGPSNADLTPAKPNTSNCSRTETQKSNSWELRTRPALFHPSNSTESSKQPQGRV